MRRIWAALAGLGLGIGGFALPLAFGMGLGVWDLQSAKLALSRHDDFKETRMNREFVSIRVLPVPSILYTRPEYLCTVPVLIIYLKTVRSKPSIHSPRAT